MAELYFEDLVIESADFGGESSLPAIKMLNLFDGKLGVSLDEDDELYVNYGRVKNAFPYRSQDSYDRALNDKTYRSVVLENDYIKAVFMPCFGGKLWSLYDKVQEKELLFKNDVVRPCNLAVRNAWMSGGVEWNCGFFGHGPYTCSDINTAITKLDDGTPVLRFYYFERVRAVVVQMDFFLPDDSKVLFARMRITNPNEDVIPMYWWSNIAVCETDNSRVVVPADEVYGVINKTVTKYTVTEDDTYPVRTPIAKDFFWKTKDDTRRYICQLDETGYGLCQTSTNRLKGRKLFVWGNSQGGHRWMNYLTADDKAGRYSEIQCGLARTQYESLPMPPCTTWEWLEAYGPMQADASRIHSDLKCARAEAERYLDSVITADDLEKLLKDTKKMATSPAEKIVQSVDGWGALEVLRRKKQDVVIMNTHLDFGSTASEQSAWENLLKTGSVGEYDVNDVPVSYMAQNEWRELLETALEGKDRDNWYAHYQYGTMLVNADEYEKGEKHLLRSLSLKENAWACYVMSVKCNLTNDTQGEREYMLRAYNLCKGNVSLAKEVFECLCRYEMYSDVIAMFESECPDVQNNSRCKFYYITALSCTGRLDEAEELLCGRGKCLNVPDVREGEVSLSKLWFDIQDRKKARNMPYKDKTELPRELDFRSHV